jgi:carbonic anhydrase/acetyltransferase-like protein (isoleucine patch superfamily)
MAPSPILMPYKGITPVISPTAFVAPGSAVIGDAVIGDDTNIWFNVTIRADVNTVRIGKRTNIQDGSTCHVTYKTGALVIGDNVTVGHNAILHACTIEDLGFVGMGATVMDGAVVESGGMLAAGALLSPGKRVKKGEVWAGVPAKFMRPMTEAEINYLPWSAQHYVDLGHAYLQTLKGMK